MQHRYQSWMEWSFRYRNVIDKSECPCSNAQKSLTFPPTKSTAKPAHQSSKLDRSNLLLIPFVDSAGHWLQHQSWKITKGRHQYDVTIPVGRSGGTLRIEEHGRTRFYPSLSTLPSVCTTIRNCFKTRDYIPTCAPWLKQWLLWWLYKLLKVGKLFLNVSAYKKNLSCGMNALHSTLTSALLL